MQIKGHECRSEIMQKSTGLGHKYISRMRMCVLSASEIANGAWSKRLAAGAFVVVLGPVVAAVVVGIAGLVVAVPRVVHVRFCCFGESGGSLCVVSTVLEGEVGVCVVREALAQRVGFDDDLRLKFGLISGLGDFGSSVGNVFDHERQRELWGHAGGGVAAFLEESIDGTELGFLAGGGLKGRAIRRAM